MDVASIVLAGGLGRRMGIPKIWLRLGNKPIYLYALDDPVRTLLVTRSWLIPPLVPPDVEIVIDDGLGPVKAIEEALSYVEEEVIVLRPVDMPFLSRDIISRYIDEEHITVFASDDRIHRISAIWPARLLRESLGVRRLQDMYKGKSYRVIKLGTCESLNINYIEDLILGLKCLEESHRGVRSSAERESNFHV